MEVQHEAPAPAPFKVESPAENTDWTMLAIAAAGALGLIVFLNKT